jgi:hypothetical protein
MGRNWGVDMVVFPIGWKGERIKMGVGPDDRPLSI